MTPAARPKSNRKTRQSAPRKGRTAWFFLFVFRKGLSYTGIGNARGLAAATPASRGAVEIFQHVILPERPVDGHPVQHAHRRLL